MISQFPTAPTVRFCSGYLKGPVIRKGHASFYGPGGTKIEVVGILASVALPSLSHLQFWV
ncbi:MAG: hypothetical protein CM1200mP9_02000 [Gammaproteobacteria bacterium]|nr:MAG: hypothetical protein CM1200mP9_02000 [Gammaproteobacteria bacterium]